MNGCPSPFFSMFSAIHLVLYVHYIVKLEVILFHLKQPLMPLKGFHPSRYFFLVLRFCSAVSTSNLFRLSW